MAVVGQPASLKKLCGLPSQLVLGTTTPKRGDVTTISLVVEPWPTPPAVVVTLISNGNACTPVTPAGGVGNVGVMRRMPVRRLLIVTSNVTRTLPGRNAPTALAWKFEVLRSMTSAPSNE